MPARSLVSRAVPAALAATGAAFGLWYQLFRRPLPKTSGRLRVRGLESRVEVLRARHGVPHIKARSGRDLAFAIGFCHGQDRLWQLEFFRRATAGRLSEFAGPDTLRVDRMMRTLGLQRMAERESERIPAAVRERLSAYATGINAAIDAVSALPIEFQLARLEPAPWEVAHLLASSK